MDSLPTDLKLHLLHHIASTSLTSLLALISTSPSFHQIYLSNQLPLLRSFAHAFIPPSCRPLALAASLLHTEDFQVVESSNCTETYCRCKDIDFSAFREGQIRAGWAYLEFLKRVRASRGMVTVDGGFMYPSPVETVKRMIQTHAKFVFMLEVLTAQHAVRAQDEGTEVGEDEASLLPFRYNQRPSYEIRPYLQDGNPQSLFSVSNPLTLRALLLYYTNALSDLFLAPLDEIRHRVTHEPSEWLKEVSGIVMIPTKDQHDGHEMENFKGEIIYPGFVALFLREECGRQFVEDEMAGYEHQGEDCEYCDGGYFLPGEETEITDELLVARFEDMLSDSEWRYLRDSGVVEDHVENIVFYGGVRRLVIKCFQLAEWDTMMKALVAESPDEVLRILFRFEYRLHKERYWPEEMMRKGRERKLEEDEWVE